MMSKYYVVQKDGVPAVWQTAPEKLGRLLESKIGYSTVPDAPSDTRAEALVQLRKLFPGFRPVKSA